MSLSFDASTNIWIHRNHPRREVATARRRQTGISLAVLIHSLRGWGLKFSARRATRWAVLTISPQLEAGVNHPHHIVEAAVAAAAA